jgi:hypothetical protein
VIGGGFWKRNAFMDASKSQFPNLNFQIGSNVQIRISEESASEFRILDIGIYLGFGDRDLVLRMNR